MNVKILSNSKRIFIRREKARIRRNVLNIEEQGKLLNSLYQQFHQV